jgi:4-hydroxybenzoate polyprenyltransferase
VPVSAEVPGSRGHPAGALGIVHPFPSVLVAFVVAAIAGLAGGSPVVVVTLALGMLGLQVSIGATNDLADLARDRAVGAPKPLPAGQVSVRTARAVAVIGALTGFALAATVGIDVLVVAIAGYACGIGYDLWLRTRGLAWVAYMAAIPLLLVYAWLGAAGTLPPSWALLLPLAAAVGPALHLSNSLVDVHSDAMDAAGGLAGRLGRRRALVGLAGLLTVVYGLAWVMVTTRIGRDSAGEGGSSGVAIMTIVGMLVATALAIVGIGLSAGRSDRARAVGWAVQATATAILGISLVASVRA